VYREVFILWLEVRVFTGEDVPVAGANLLMGGDSKQCLPAWLLSIL